MTKIMYDVIVAGAGFAGAVLARQMADAGQKVLLLEKRPRVGGNMYDEPDEDGILIHRYGPHLFHTNSEKVGSYLKRFADWYEYRHRVNGKVNGKIVPIPFNFTSIEKLFDDDAANRLKSILLKNYPENARVSVFDLIDHHELSIRELGSFIYEKIFLNYTAKQWGVSIEKVGTSTINRVPAVIGCNDEYFQDAIQMMPAKGFTALITNMLDHPNIDIRLNANAKKTLRLDFGANAVVFDGKTFGGPVFFTGAIDDLMDRRFGVLPYRSLDLEFESVDCEYYQQCAVVNYPNEERFTRVTEFKHANPQPVKRVNRTTILKEYPKEFTPNGIDEPYYPVINDDSQKTYRKYADSVKSIKNLYLCGRLAEYKYCNMDAVILSALELADSVP